MPLAGRYRTRCFSVTFNSNELTLIVIADPQRVFLAISGQSNAPIVVGPRDWPSTASGYTIQTADRVLEFFYSRHGDSVMSEWYAFTPGLNPTVNVMEVIEVVK